MIYILCAVSCAAALAAILKIILVKRSLSEIRRQLPRLISEDTNVTLSVSSHDGEVRALASELDCELRELRRRRLRYENGDRELHDAVTNISHDLRTPLTALSGYLDLLEREELTPSAARFASRIRERADAMRALTEELFRYTVITSETELNYEELDLRAVFEDTLLSFYGELKKRGIEPVVSLPDAPVRRRLDRVAVSRVIGNIVGNAVKYSDGDLTASLDDAGRMRFSNAAAELSGVDVEKLFDRFYTVRTARTSTGLGLSVARHLSERMGGRVSASFDGGVLTVTVEIP